jgi:hypothetical protein
MGGGVKKGGNEGYQFRVCVSTITGKLPVLELALPFSVLVPLPEVGNPISGTAFTVHFFLFLARLPIQSRTSALYLKFWRQRSTLLRYLKLEKQFNACERKF